MGQKDSYFFIKEFDLEESLLLGEIYLIKTTYSIVRDF